MFDKKFLDEIIDAVAERVAAKLAETQPEQPSPAAATTPLDTIQAAEYLGCSKQRLEGLRHTGGGPVYSKPPGSRLVRYRVADLDAWLASGKRAHTSESGK